MPKCQNCGMKLQNTRGSDRLIITNNPIGIQCVYCWSFHSWATGVLIKKEVKKAFVKIFINNKSISIINVSSYAHSVKLRMS